MISPFKSLRVRLIGSVVLIEIVMLSLLVWSNVSVIRGAYAERLWESSTAMLDQIATTSASYLLEVDYASLEDYLRNFVRRDALLYLVVLDADRVPIVSLGQVPSTLGPAADDNPLRAADGTLDLVRDIRIGSQAMGQAYAGFSLAPMRRAIDAAKLRNIVIAATEILLSALATIFIGVHLTRRIGRLAQAAQQVGSGDYSVKVPAELDDEVGTTANAFNRMVSEISQRTRRLEAALARERVVEQTAIDGMITYDQSTRILSANPAMGELFGLPQEQLIGAKTELLLSPAARCGASGSTGIDWTATTGGQIEVLGRRADGGDFPLELHIGQVEIDGTALFAATLHDITERKRAEHECQTLLRGNRYLVHKSLAVQEEERRHLAQELHDELGQCMTAIQADAENIATLSAGRDRKVCDSARAIVGVSSRMYDVVHSMMQRLRPSVLDNFGLVAAINDELAGWRSRYPTIACSFEKHGELDNLGEQTNISLYRIVQESLTNIAKHAAASQVSLLLSRKQHQIRLSIKDNGCGLKPGKPGHGLGLVGMRERAEALQGSFAVISRPGDGMTIDIVIPVGQA